MGIRGLEKFLDVWARTNLGFVPFEKDMIISSQSVICIDAMGFAFYLIEQLADHRLQGGMYGLYDEEFSRAVRKLIDTGLYLVFFFDGNEQSGMKSATAQKRRDQRDDQWMALKAACQSRRLRATFDDSEVPFPPLIIEQLKSSLHTLQLALTESGDPEAASRIEIRLCASEEDQEIAKYCQRHNTDPYARAYCYGQDSDFLVFANCPYIPFGKLRCIPDPLFTRATLLAEQVWS